MLGPVIAATTEGSRVGSMFVFFLVALVIVAPFGYPRIRAVMRERRAALGLDDAPIESPDASATGDAGPVRSADDLALVIDAITVAARELAHDADDSRIIDVPLRPLVDGRPGSPAVVDALLDDAVRRSGLRSEWISGNRPGRQLLVRTDDPSR